MTAAGLRTLRRIVWKIVGTIAGAAIMAIIQIGCSQQGLPNWVQEIITGTIIVGAVALDRWRSKS